MLAADRVDANLRFAAGHYDSHPKAAAAVSDGGSRTIRQESGARRRASAGAAFTYICGPATVAVTYASPP